MKKVKDFITNNYITFLIYALIGWLYEVLWMWFVVAPKKFTNRGVLYGPFLPIYGFGMLIILFCLGKFVKKKHYLGNTAYLIASMFTITTFVFTTIIKYTQAKILSVTEYLSRYGLYLLIANIIVIIIIFLLTRKVEKIKKIDVTIILIFLLIWVLTTSLEFASHFAIDKLSGQWLWDYRRNFLNIQGRVNWNASRNFALGGTFLLYVVQPLIDKLLIKLSSNKKLAISLIFGIPMILDFIFHVFLKLI